ncbi:MAG: FKBP-type peptidyl-prolyl cis-trans isomerase N-terminal domain-containing protein [Rikenellaceae bacterium]
MKKVIFAAMVAGAFVMASCGGNKNATITKGSLSKFDTLSYAVGVNLASMATTQLADLPLDYDELVKSLISSANGSNKVSREDATALLQDYFMNKRQARSADVNAARDAADSIALANGADAAVVREARGKLTADASMFEDAAERKTISAALGNDLGNSIAMAKIPAQTVWIKQAFTDVLAGEAKLTDAVANTEIQKFFTVTLPAANQKASEEWLASIAKKSGVEVTESGIYYKVEKAGSEVMATDDRDVVKVKYTGKNREGKVFDSSRYADMAEDRLEQLKSRSEDGSLPEDGEVIEFPLNRVIKGWTEGMKLVGVGGRISLWIPAELAYGARGAGSDIGANEALYFDVELVEVTPYVDPAAAEEETEE